ncbi:MAG TPA: winged helix-turn-helix domain-containing protein, partial [Steroidobacteraceae bacterium]|nr:winged helix-turn-helix domain-containing protein [Steroidobacteraceae bacterium]
MRVDPATDEVFIDGLPTKLEPRCMNLLVCLAEHAGQVMSVERLLDEVWKDVVVNPDSVYQTVASLRRVLKDDAREPRYIDNVVRRGYRLIAPVIREGSVAVDLGVADGAAPGPAPEPAQAQDIAPQSATTERRVRRVAPL